MILVSGCVAPGDCSGDAGVPAPRRVILLVIDTLRKDHVGAYGYERNTTPNFDRLSQKGILFKNPFATCSWTQPSMASMFTSTYPSVHHVLRPPDSTIVSSAVLSPEFVTLTEFLKDQGMKTQAVSSQPWCNDLSGFDQGFDDFAVVSKIIEPREAEMVMNKSLEWLQKQSPDTRFFLYIHIMGPHFPYIPPGRYKGMFTSSKVEKVKRMLEGLDYADQMLVLNKMNKHLFKNDPGLLAEVVGLYDEEVAYSDAQLARLLEALDSRGLMQGTMLIVCSDHGEEFLEHDKFLHGHSLYRELIEVPFLIYYPPLGEGVEVEGLVSIIDIYPTIVELFDKDAPYPCQGRSLVPHVSDNGGREFVLSELFTRERIKNLTTNTHSLIYQPASGEEEERTRLYDLINDPREKKDVSEKLPETVAQMLSILRSMDRENQNIKIEPVRSRNLTPRQARQLRALGYMNQ